MKRVIVIGCPGGGKSTFARKLKKATGLPLYYLDMMYHRANRTVVSRFRFNLKLRLCMAKPRWIIDGNYNRTLEWRFKRCDTVFLLDYPLETCLKGAESRIGKPREDMPWVEQEFDADFKAHILNFEAKNLKRIYALIEKYKDKKEIIVFRNRSEADEYLNGLA